VGDAKAAGMSSTTRMSLPDPYATGTSMMHELATLMTSAATTAIRSPHTTSKSIRPSPSSSVNRQTSLTVINTQSGLSPYTHATCPVVMRTEADDGSATADNRMLTRPRPYEPTRAPALTPCFRWDDGVAPLEVTVTQMLLPRNQLRKRRDTTSASNGKTTSIHCYIEPRPITGASIVRPGTEHRTEGSDNQYYTAKTVREPRCWKSPTANAQPRPVNPNQRSTNEARSQTVKQGDPSRSLPLKAKSQRTALGVYDSICFR